MTAGAGANTEEMCAVRAIRMDGEEGPKLRQGRACRRMRGMTRIGDAGEERAETISTSSTLTHGETGKQARADRRAEMRVLAGVHAMRACDKERKRGEGQGSRGPATVKG
ncbi:hypothetical protein BCV70DRAFT_78572 [Testicularia cyperi]|uniref:Uncharacterized protein n=1 Tax=Testicularia cyperi TaxID=1882483 RepID=A0A317XUE4_9BASI|nr:hypothetical protein BCV70DRAFT_78572 [Testicularia cyperi]